MSSCSIFFNRVGVVRHYYSCITKHERTRSLIPQFLSPLALQELIAGGTAGGIAKTSIAPLERVKILFQATIICTSYFWASLYHDHFLEIAKDSSCCPLSAAPDTLPLRQPFAAAVALVGFFFCARCISSRIQNSTKWDPLVQGSFGSFVNSLAPILQRGKDPRTPFLLIKEEDPLSIITCVCGNTKLCRSLLPSQTDK